MKSEIFVDLEKLCPEVNPDTEIQIKELEESFQLLSELGLETQAKQTEALTRGKKNLPSDFLPLTEAQKNVWEAWLPTRYEFNAPNRDRELRNYHYDTVPRHVLELWKKCKDLQIFDSFEIWTPEKVKAVDPILIGVLGDNHYLLARWAESDEHLISFEEIKGRVKKQRLLSGEKMVFYLWWFIGSLFLGILLTLVVDRLLRIFNIYISNKTINHLTFVLGSTFFLVTKKIERIKRNQGYDE